MQAQLHNTDTVTSSEARKSQHANSNNKINEWVHDECFAHDLLAATMAVPRQYWAILRKILENKIILLTNKMKMIYSIPKILFYSPEMLTVHTLTGQQVNTTQPIA